METNQITPTGVQQSSNLKLSDERKHIYKFLLAPFSFESSNHFTKVHKRKFLSFGCIHEFR